MQEYNWSRGAGIQLEQEYRNKSVARVQEGDWSRSTGMKLEREYKDGKGAGVQKCTDYSSSCTYVVRRENATATNEHLSDAMNMLRIPEDQTYHRTTCRGAEGDK